MNPTISLRFFSLFLGAALCVVLLAAGVTQEVPMGSVKGRLTMKENGRPLPEAYVTLEYFGDPGGEFKKVRHVESKKDGTFELTNIPSGTYLVSAEAQAHTAKSRVWIVGEGPATPIDLALEPQQPYLELYASQRVFTPSEKPSFEIRGFDPAETATITYYRLDLNKIVSKGGLRTLLYSFSRPGNEGGSDPSLSATDKKSIEKTLSGKDPEGVFTEPIVLPPLAEGFYYIVCKVSKQSRATFLNVSTIGLVTKTAGNQALCYVTDLVTGAPVRGVDIQAPVSGSLHTVAETQADGTASANVPGGDESKVVLVASKGRSVAVVDFDNEGSSGDEARIFAYSDRPIYRPGDTVQFKGIVRKRSGQNYELPGTGNVAIEVRDTDETTIQKMTLPLSAKGTFNGSFTSNIEDKPGVYSVKVTIGDSEDTLWVNLAAYRKPEYSITVTPMRNYFIFGDKASAKVKAEYFFGGPVIGAKVEAYVSRARLYERDADEQDYGDEEGYYEPESASAGEYYEKVDVTTDEKGEAIIDFDTRSDGDTATPDYDMEYTVSASLTDESNKVFDAMGKVVVVRGDISQTLTVDRYIAEPGERVEVSSKVTKQGTDTPIVNRDVTLQFGTEHWDGDVATFLPRGTVTAKTNDHGIATLPITAGNEGSLVLKAFVMDDSGRTVTAESYLYVDTDAVSGPPTAKFTLTLDKRRYKPGDTCRVMIQTDRPGESALITVQAERVIAKYVVPLTKRSTVHTFLVEGSFSPNVWVSAVAIRNKRLLEDQSRLVVDVKQHDLDISITPSQPDYQPGDTATLAIKTTDADGKPVPADLSLGVVDESIYAIRPDSTNIKSGFYPIREDAVRTNYSFEEIYLDGGDKAGGNIPVRSNFLDTADWQPTVATDASGSATVTVKLPDNLTSWRATVVGATDRTEVGMAHINFRARKPMTIRLELPSFLVQQDTQQITAIVTNDTGQDRDVNVRLEAQGAQVEGNLSTQIHVSANKPQALHWTVHAQEAGVARFTAYAWIDEQTRDAEERSIHVQPHGRLTREMHSGEVSGTQKVTFTVAPNADQNTGSLTLTLSPTLGGTIYQSLDQLIDFPYGCVEQTMSRFLPSVLLSSTLKDLNIRSDLESKVPAIVNSGFSRLAKMHHSDGSWGWWEYDEGDMFMTAYVLHGLKLAERAGFPTKQVDPSGAVAWGKGQLKEETLDRYERRDYLYLAYACALYGQKEPVRAALERVKPETGSEFALEALAYDQIGEPARRDEMLAQLHRIAIIEGNAAHFPSKDEWWSYGAEANAFPLMALTELAPKDSLTPMLVRYLLRIRKGNDWDSTRDSSLALVGLTRYLRLTKDLAKPADVQVKVNGGQPRVVHFVPGSLDTLTLKLTMPMSELKRGVNDVEFIASAGATCYYSGELRQVEVEDRLLPLRSTSGLTIQRNYYLLEPQRLEDGRMQLMPSKRSIEEAKPGDLVRVELILNSNQEREFLMVEDPIPSGCRITDREYVDQYEEWNYWWTQTIVRDDRAAFFMRSMPAGMHTLTYTMRAEQIGDGHALPTSVSNMYDPSQTASGGETLLRIQP